MTDRPSLQWTAPAPLWPELTPAGNGKRAAFQRPAILRFNGDDFMEEFMNLLAAQPQRLGEWQAAPETWRGPATTPIPVASLPSFAQRLHRLRLGLAAVAESEKPGSLSPAGAMIPAGKLKLYQPAHQRFYMVSANLVCRLPGLPDRLPDSGAGEQTSFVIRRLLPANANVNPAPTGDNLDQFDEYAFAMTAAGPRWQRLGPFSSPATQTTAPGEEQLPLFGVSYDDAGHSRRLLAGVIPVAKREVYVGAAITNGDNAAANGQAPAGGQDGRIHLFQADVIEPWRRLHDMIAKSEARMAESDEEPDEDDKEAFEQNLANQEQGASWYILLDLAGYLERFLPAVWSALAPSGAAPAGTAQAALANALQGAAGSLIGIGSYRQHLEETAVSYPVGGGWPPPFSLDDLGLSPDELEELVAAALAETPPPVDTPPPPLAAQLSAANSGGPAWFIIRCLFTRPDCLDDAPLLFSPPTDPFQLANFFDPDAPARPIRISLPVDTSPAGLRKFNKNTAFIISDVLACQMERMGEITLGDLVRSVLPWPLYKPLPDPKADCAAGNGLSLGMICSLSIPIITICALILLMIMVTLLDMIFRWLPYFIVCYPLPGLKAKEGS